MSADLLDDQSYINSTSFKSIIAFWLIGAILFKFDSVYLTISIIVYVFFNLGERRPGQYSAYNIFNKGYQHLMGDLRGEQIEAELRNQVALGGVQQKPSEKHQGPTLFSSKEANLLCPCKSGKKVKRCCGAVSAEDKLMREHTRDVERRRQQAIDSFKI